MPEDWFEKEDDADDDDEAVLTEYDITAAPNDFNITTIFNFIESGKVKIPSFQRNYVWDIKRASKLIESIIIGLPVPQIFLFEESRNNFLVIDGQQRLMSIYYFMKGRFPQKTKRDALRRVFDEHGTIPDDILLDDDYFDDFAINLSDRLPQPLHGKDYEALGELKTTFDLRTIRNIIIKQNAPKDDDSSIYEIFYRLNTGGVNLGPQEIRMSLYHSDFYTMLYRANIASQWRNILGLTEPDVRMKDIEMLLRGFALLIYSDSYKPSMVAFLNESSRHFKKLPLDTVHYLERLFQSFLEACSLLDPKAFHGKTGKFSVSIYDAVFASVCANPFKEHKLVMKKLDPKKLELLKVDESFSAASQSRTTSKQNVISRLSRAAKMLRG